MKLPRIFGALATAAILFATSATVSAATTSDYADGVNWTKKVITVEKLLTVRDVVKTRVSATIKGAQVVDETFSRDGTCRVVMQVPLFGV